MASRLTEDSGLNSLKIGLNAFTNIQPLVELLKIKGRQYRCLDISTIPIDQSALQNGLVDVIGMMSNLEELTICECFGEIRMPSLRVFIDNMMRGCRILKALDLSKNTFSKDNLNYFLKVMAEQGSNTIEALAIGQLNLGKESSQFVHTAINSMRNLRSLNISGNPNIGCQTVQQILRSLINNNRIEDLDLSQTGIGADHLSLQLLGDLIKSNPNLRSIGLQRLGMTEVVAHHIVEPLSTALNVESI